MVMDQDKGEPELKKFIMPLAPRIFRWRDAQRAIERAREQA